MEENFRNALIIISAIIIAAIFIHGLWTIRKNKNPYKLKTSTSKVDPVSRDFDTKGFDQDGVSQVKVITQTALTGEIDNPPAEEEIPHQPAPAPHFNEEPIPADISAKTPEQPIEEVEQVALEEVTQEESLQGAIAVETELDISDVPQNKSVYQEPVINAKPTVDINKSTKAKSGKSRIKKEAIKRNQFELNFDDAELTSASNDRTEPSFGSEATHEEKTEEQTKSEIEAPKIETEVIVLSVVMPEGHAMSGAALLPSLLTLGMKYGDMNIFHRHEDNAGNGKVTFSLANMMNPGTFDLDNIETFTTQGVSFFMTLPNAGDPFTVFDNMLSAAKQLSQEFNAQLLDEKRSVMTMQTEQHYTSKIREFERKNRIASA